MGRFFDYFQIAGMALFLIIFWGENPTDRHIRTIVPEQCDTSAGVAARSEAIKRTGQTVCSIKILIPIPISIMPPNISILLSKKWPNLSPT